MLTVASGEEAFAQTKGSSSSAKKTAASKASSKTPGKAAAKPSSKSAKAAEKKDVAENDEEHEAPTKRTSPPTIEPGDFAQLSASFSRTYDGLLWLPKPDEAVRYRVESARLKAERLAALVSRFADLIEERRTNIRRGTAALYLLGRSHKTPAFMGPQMTSTHLLVTRCSVKDDASELDRRMPAYRDLREELNAAVDHRDSVERDAAAGRLAAVPERATSDKEITNGITEWRPAAVKRINDALTDERRFDTRALLAVMAMEQMARAAPERTALHAFAPPPPGGEPYLKPFVSDDTPMPSETGPGRKAAAEPTLAPPDSRGLNLAASPGAKVRSAAAGKVGFAGPFRGYGNLVIIEHDDNLFSVYGHLGVVLARPGSRVKAGSNIGEAGGGGSVYFEVRRNEEAVPAATLLETKDPAGVVIKR